MSYFEDEGYDIIPPWDEDFYIELREYQWSKGFHRTIEGDDIKLSDMNTRHLQNTINLFEGLHDVSALTNELNKRNK